MAPQPPFIPLRPSSAFYLASTCIRSALSRMKDAPTISNGTGVKDAATRARGLRARHGPRGVYLEDWYTKCMLLMFEGVLGGWLEVEGENMALLVTFWDWSGILTIEVIGSTRSYHLGRFHDRQFQAGIPYSYPTFSKFGALSADCNGISLQRMIVLERPLDVERSGWDLEGVTLTAGSKRFWRRLKDISVSWALWMPVNQVPSPQYNSPRFAHLSAVSPTRVFMQSHVCIGGCAASSAAAAYAKREQVIQLTTVYAGKWPHGQVQEHAVPIWYCIESVQRTACRELLKWALFGGEPRKILLIGMHLIIHNFGSAISGIGWLRYE
ncbi:hypothetical protein BDN70DRAFT_926122 [Pholiota conissans]|uniref:Uncharacterized protein n=1 Tax=Pholiota conissans TaxID=109636 RepID=A0A9P6CM94_9AGAR|nr:hypothetical protein BDN70DRAFT_926122 [Pholiota conissans]